MTNETQTAKQQHEAKIARLENIKIDCDSLINSLKFTMNPEVDDARIRTYNFIYGPGQYGSKEYRKSQGAMEDHLPLTFELGRKEGDQIRILFNERKMTREVYEQFLRQVLSNWKTSHPTFLKGYGLEASNFLEEHLTTPYSK